MVSKKARIAILMPENCSSFRKRNLTSEKRDTF